MFLRGVTYSVYIPITNLQSLCRNYFSRSGCGQMQGQACLPVFFLLPASVPHGLLWGVVSSRGRRPRELDAVGTLIPFTMAEPVL